MSADPDVCLACGDPGTCNGHLCRPCFRHRRHTIHWRWNDLRYLAAMRGEVAGPPAMSALAARFVQSTPEADR